MASNDTAASEVPDAEFPPDGPPKERRAWFQRELKKHTHPTTGKGWNQADVAREAEGCNEGHVSLVLGGERHSGDVTKRVQRVVARVLRRSQADLFGHVCKNCPKCGTDHTPRRVMAAAE